MTAQIVTEILFAASWFAIGALTMYQRNSAKEAE